MVTRAKGAQPRNQNARKPDAARATLALRLTPELKEQVKAIADAEGKNLNAWVVELFEERCKQHKQA
ncbi:toxin-antitoxin system HicB family antitoxin (plasmid) [Citrobacter portucalensis]|uniref:toxin-antitoxin system HicB family antitoxin n=1 Tax=Citrobacter portucalensis TaxID=1639133 RepID=UPI0021C12848|nr:toxin-antitoxin system HicB family antitoxin [Leclercia adecarboxylata ATCC 23216 = NBRC 102595]